ncbi:MAG: protein translocase subunit SecD [Planctomycetaceae bacterium]|jgi:SecD/SecF fusion protein|nr:protein translocase subunit SecD [Planctomycetaceae bacterium]
MPRIVNFTIIAIAVVFLLTQSLRSNTTVLVQDNASVTTPNSTKPNEAAVEPNASGKTADSKPVEEKKSTDNKNTDNENTTKNLPATTPELKTQLEPETKTNAQPQPETKTDPQPESKTPTTPETKNNGGDNVVFPTSSTPAEPPKNDPASDVDPFNAQVAPQAHDHAHAHDHNAEEDAAKANANAERWRSFRTLLFNFGIFAAIVIVCFVIGNAAAKRWRMSNEYGFKIAVTLLAFAGGIIAAVASWDRIMLGIDLSGGVVLVYDIPKSASNESKRDSDGQISANTMEQLKSAISTRVNPGGQREITITPLGQSRIQVIIPRAEDAEVQRIQKVISESGALVFRIVASRAYAQDAHIISLAEPSINTQISEIRSTQGDLLAQWFPVYEGEEGQFRYNPEFLTRIRNEILEVLVLCNDGEDVTGKYLTNVGRGSNGIKPGVTFNFNSQGAMKFGRLTTSNSPDPAQPQRQRHLGIILNEKLYSAPGINGPISDHGIIEFNPRSGKDAMQQLNNDIEDLIKVLNAGALPVELSKEPASKLLIGATLGEDTIRKGEIALIGSAIVVLLFMLFYYRLAGVIACFCVITNMALLVTIMITLKAPFTLPGLAGVVLTIGMAVDANILIYERLREELNGGSSLRLAIRNAYSKALSAILDSNITSIMVGVVLYTIGTEQIKGFAITLVLGILLSMFTAIYCAKIIMDVLEAQRSISTFSMLQMFKRPNINFIGARKFTITFSILISIAALVLTAARGSSILDIDFVGGVSLEVLFDKPLNIDEVRNKLDDNNKNNPNPLKKLGDSSVQIVQESGTALGTEQVTANTRYIITTPIPRIKDTDISADEYLNVVQETIKEIFKDNLRFCKFDYTIDKVAGDKENKLDIKIKSSPAINIDSLESIIDSASKSAVRDKLIANTFRYELTSKDYNSLDKTKPIAEWEMTAYAASPELEVVLGSIRSRQNATPEFQTSTTVGSSVAGDTRVAGGLAILASLIGIIIYMGVRFKGLAYGFAAAIGLVHDVIVVLGLIAVSAWVANWLSIVQISEFKISLAVVAAFLTIIAYSINDTIILFDRVRENRGKSPTLTDRMINAAVNQTLSRTVLTSLTTFFVTLILYFLGGQGIHTFAFAMCVGVAFGTYSTIGVCAPLLYWMVGTPSDKVNTES